MTQVCDPLQRRNSKDMVSGKNYRILTLTQTCTFTAESTKVQSKRPPRASGW